MWLLAHSIQQTSLQLNFFQTTEPEMLIGCFYKNSTAIWNLELENFGIVRDASDRPEVGCGHSQQFCIETQNLLSSAGKTRLNSIFFLKP